MKLPFVSIVIPSRDSERTIGNLLDSIFSMNYSKRKYEVIVVDSSSDKTLQIIKKYPVKLIRISRTNGINIALACNVGIKTSKGKFIAFVDSDCAVNKNWLRDLLRPFSNKGVVCVGGKVITVGNIYDKYSQHAYKSPIRNINKKYITDNSNFHKCMWPIGSNFMARKSILKEVSYFNETLQFYEEVDLFWRICKKGYKILLIPKARVKHIYKRSFLEMFKTYFRYGKGCGYFCRKYKKSKFAKSRLMLFFGVSIFYLLSLVIFLSVFNQQLSTYLLVLPLIPYFYLFFHYFLKLEDKKYSLLFPLLDFVFCGIAYILGMVYSLIKPISFKTRK